MQFVEDTKESKENDDEDSEEEDEKPKKKGEKAETKDSKPKKEKKGTSMKTKDPNSKETIEFIKNVMKKKFRPHVVVSKLSYIII